MIPRKPIEWTFRRLPLLIVLVVVPPVLVAVALFRLPVQYQSSASVLVADPSAVTGPAPTANNRLATPAEAQVQALESLLSTRSFIEEVAIDAHVVPSVDQNGVAVVDPAVPESQLRKIRSKIRKDLSVAATGPNVLAIAAKSTDPARSQALVAATLARYQENVAAQAEHQRQISLQYYNERLAVVQQQADTAVAELNAYRTAHPLPEGANPNTLPVDPNLQALESHANLMTAQVQGLVQAMGQLDADSASARQQMAAQFTVEDEPLLPARPVTASLTRTVGYPLAAAVAGLLLALAYVYMTYRSDHTIRSSEDLAGLGVPLLGYVPHLNARQNQPFYRRLRFPRRGFARRLAASIHSDLSQESAP
jgi:capsular polysaccharide biosynthesis protein